MDPDEIDQALKYLRKDTFDPYSMCRCCLMTGFPVKYVLKKFKTHAVILQECTQIVIEDDDGLPLGLCLECYSDLFSSYSFLQRCRRAQAVLKTSAGSKTPDNEADDEVAEMKVALCLQPTEVDLPDETDELIPIDLTEPAMDDTVTEPLPIFEDENEPFKESSFETMPIYHSSIEAIRKSEIIIKKHKMVSPIKSKKYIFKKPTVEPFKRPVTKHAPCSSKKSINSLPLPKSSKDAIKKPTAEPLKRPVMKHTPCTSKKPTDSLPPPKSSNAINKEPKQVQCKVCDKKLNDSTLLKQHMDTHIIRYNNKMLTDDLHNYSKRPPVEKKKTCSLPPEKPKGLMKIDLNNFKIMNKLETIRQPTLTSLTILPLNTESTSKED